MPLDFTFADLIDRHGESIASWYLVEIEKAAGLKPQTWNTDPEARLAYAFWLQDNPAQERIAA